ncbi:DUF5129 domain-containing protein [Actinomyces gaoshouyii]|uniref:DUF5129 domain-containing protein n=1 Tax=Actinomyces gaoshouyii TaxID=1960083 RepID=UPI0009BE326C|nr:DUF5129 domain-containing protein [Actinomyces gaoshouyii]ARD40997.1 hypothetical protein B6G06_00185 [Actinomyces gaoshouyii]
MTSPPPRPSGGRVPPALITNGVIAAIFFAIPLALIIMLDLDPEGWFIVAVLAALGVLIVEHEIVAPPRRGRRMLLKAQESYARAEAGAGAASAAAARIPTGDAHGAQVLKRLRWYEGRRRETGEVLAGLGRMRWIDWHDPALSEAAAKLSDDVSGLSAINDAVRNAAALLTRAPGWEDAWENECGPLREDLDIFRELCQEVGDEAPAAPPIADSELGWARACGARLTALRAQLASGALPPGAALDELDAMAAEIRARADALARRALAAEAPPGEEAGLAHYREYIGTWKLPDDDDRYAYSGTWQDDDETGASPAAGENGERAAVSYNPAATIRLHDYSPGIRVAGIRWRGLATASQYSSPIERILDVYLQSRSTGKE